MSLMRLSLKKAAQADMSRAAYRKSGAVLGGPRPIGEVPKGRLKAANTDAGSWFSVVPGGTGHAFLTHPALRAGLLSVVPSGLDIEVMHFDYLSRGVGRISIYRLTSFSPSQRLLRWLGRGLAAGMLR